VNTTFWEAVFYLHLVAMAFFLGGQLLLATAVVRPFGVRRTASSSGRSRAASAGAR
jgi:uncharacterized integral membrane protein